MPKTLITSRDPKGLHFIKLCEDTYNKAMLTDIQAQQLNENGGKFQDGLRELIKKFSAYDNIFKLLKTFEFIVPIGYNHATQLASFERENRDKLFSFDMCITDANFSKATNCLIPGRNYVVKFFQIKCEVYSEDCLMFLRAQRAILAGAQGLSLVWTERKDEFPSDDDYEREIKVASFDEKNALWFGDKSRHWVPLINKRYTVHNDKWDFLIRDFSLSWGKEDLTFLICFCAS